MSLPAVIKPYTFTNNVETADAVKVNSDFDIAYAGINALNSWTSSQASYLQTILGDHVVRVITASDIVAANDNILLVDASAGDVNLTLLSGAGLISLGLVVVKTDSHMDKAVNLVAAAGDTVMGQTQISLTVPGEFIRIASYNQAWWRIG
jgi:hypothetical protein